MAHIRPDYFWKYKTKFENVGFKIYIYIFEGGSKDEMSIEDVKLTATETLPRIGSSPSGVLHIPFVASSFWGLITPEPSFWSLALTSQT